MRNNISDSRLDFQGFPYLNSEENNTQNLELQTKNRFAAFNSIDATFDAAMALRMRVATMFLPCIIGLSIYLDHNVN